MLNIVVPMAGHGSRFQTQGYSLPKPLIPIRSHPMVEVVIHNLMPTRPHRFIFLVLAEHITRYQLDNDLARWAPGCVIVPVDRVTEGAACTVLLARDFIDNSDALMIANSDQWIDRSIDEYLEVLDAPNVDGLIMTMFANDPKWSYVRLNAEGYVCETVEKQVISNHATVGIYNFSHGCDFVAGAERMIANNERVNNEFYVAPVYNQLTSAGQRIAIYNVGSEDAGMYGLGIPSDLEKFISLPIVDRRRLLVINTYYGAGCVSYQAFIC